MKKPEYIILFAGLGGESELWDDVNNNITHVESDPKIAAVLQKRKPNRKVIVADAYQFLLENFMKYDFAWLSPPCQSHTRMILSGKNRKPQYVDLRLYEVIMFLKRYFKGHWVVENVKPFYTPFIEPTKIIGRHLFWANFQITDFDIPNIKGFIMKGTVSESAKIKDWLGIQYEGNLYYGKNHDPCQVLRNCVHPLTGAHVHNCFLNKK